MTSVINFTSGLEILRDELDCIRIPSFWYLSFHRTLHVPVVWLECDTASMLYLDRTSCLVSRHGRLFDKWRFQPLQQ